jgi:exonuclease III
MVGCCFGFIIDNTPPKLIILSWNVRGLNNSARRHEVKLMVNSCRPDIVCLQETKLDFFDKAIVNSVMRPDFKESFIFLLVDGTRGAILLAAKGSCCQLQSPHLTNNVVTATVLDRRISNLWTITRIYGPQGDLEKKDSLESLSN